LNRFLYLYIVGSIVIDNQRFLSANSRDHIAKDHWKAIWPERLQRMVLFEGEILAALQLVLVEKV
jgi:hypothetical protein